MDNEDNLFDDDEDLLDISLADLSTEDFEQPAAEEPDEEVIELIDLVEKSDEDIDEDVIDFDDTKPLPAGIGLAERLKSVPSDNQDSDESGENGDTAAISRSDLELGDITFGTDTSELSRARESGNGIEPDTSDADIDLDISEDTLDFDDTEDYVDDGIDKSLDTEDTVDKLIDEGDTDEIITDEDNDSGESLEELFKDDEEISEGMADDLNETVVGPMESESPADDFSDGIDNQGKAVDDALVSDEVEEKLIDVSDKPVEADTGQLNETVIGPLSDEDEPSEDLKEEDDIHDQPVDEKIQLSDISLQEETSPYEDGPEESVEDSALPVEDDAGAVGKEESDDIIDASPDKGADITHRVEQDIITEEKLEKIVVKVVGEVVEKVAREVFAEVAEKVISDAIDGLKKSLEADSE
ncbi:hypothetical protein ACFL1N_17630 [Thermodesulfobacteriota bacterium]